MMRVIPLAVAVVFATWTPAAAHFANFKSPGPGMHFTQGQPLVIFADLFDSREGKGIIVCPDGQSVSNTEPPPDYSDPPREAQCSGGGTPTGWPAFQILIDGVLQTDRDSQHTTIPNTTAFNHDINPDPIGFFRFVADSGSLAPGPHEIVVRGMFSMNGTDVTPLESPPLTIYVDAPPAKTVKTLSADFSGNVEWEDVIVVGNGHAVTATGSLIIRNSLVTGLSGLRGSVDAAAIEGSSFEDSGAIDLTLGDGEVSIRDNEFRANNRLTFVASDPSVPFIIRLEGSSSSMKVFQGNRVGAGQLSFAGQNWLIGGDNDDQSNVFIGPRTVLNVAGDKTVIRGNYSHHNYRGAWSQGFNFYYQGAAADTLTEHNFIRDGSWPLQDLSGEFRYNVVYGFGHTWIRTALAKASIHHNVFAPGGDGGLNSGIQCYGGEMGLSIYNNTFDGGGAALGDFAGPTIDMSGGSQVASFRNNLVTFSRNMNNDNPGAARVTGGKDAYAYADYNAFFSPDNQNKTNYDFAGAGAHDVGEGSDGQLASNPFAGARIVSDDSRTIESTIDEAAIWQGTQGVSQVLAIFRERYSPKAGSPIIDAGDPKDNDAQGRRIDIGAIDLSGHAQDMFGKFGPGTRTMPTKPAVGADAGEGGQGGSHAATGGMSATRGNDGGTAGSGDASGTDAAIGGRSATAGMDAQDTTGGEHNLESGCNCSVIGRERRGTSTLLLAFGLFSAVVVRRGARRRARQIAIAAGISLACFALPRTAEANDYFVSNAGSDNASGLSGSPWQTLQRAWQSVKAGDTVTAEDGTYAGFACDSVSGTAVAPIVFKSRNLLGAKINAPGADVGSSASQDYIQLSSCSFIIVDGFEVSGAPRSGIAILGNSDDGSDAQGVIIQNCYSHANGGTTVAGRHDGIFSGFALNLTIQDNRIDTTGEHGIYVSNAADNPSILRNDVSNTGANCIQINADLSTGGDGLISNWLIEGNTVRDCHGSAGFNLDGVIHGVARNNVIYNAAKAGIALFQGDGAEASHDNLIVNNTVYDPSGSRSAIQVADGADNNVLFNNIFISGSTGLEVQTVTGLVHDYNLISSISGGSLATHESSPMAASLFVEPMTGNLRLSANSPAIDHGVGSLSGKAAPTSDVLGATRPAGVDYDIGAYEDSAASDAGGSGGATGAGGSRGGSGGAESDAGAKAGSDSGVVGAAGRSGGTGTGGTNTAGIGTGGTGTGGAHGNSMSTGGSDGGAADAVAGAPNATQAGCSCRTAGPSDGAMAPWLALATAGAAIVRRRKSPLNAEVSRRSDKGA